MAKILNEAGNVVNFMGSGSETITTGTTLINASGLYVEGGGTLEMEFPDGTTDTWTVPDNFILPMNVSKVTGGTATGIHAIH